MLGSTQARVLSHGPFRVKNCYAVHANVLQLHFHGAMLAMGAAGVLGHAGPSLTQARAEPWPLHASPCKRICRSYTSACPLHGTAPSMGLAFLVMLDSSPMLNCILFHQDPSPCSTGWHAMLVIMLLGSMLHW